MTSGGLPPGIIHPFSPRGRINPYPAYHWLQEHAPLYHDQFSGLWLVTSYSGCSAVLRDQRFSAALAQQRRFRDEALPSSMLTTDPPEHGRLRGPGTLLLGPASLNAQIPLVEAAIDEVMAGLDAAAEADAVTDIGEPVSVAVLASLLRIGPGHRAAFAGLARRAAVNLDPMAGPAAGAAGRRAVGELTAWLDPHVAAATRAEPDAPLSLLAADPRLTRQEMLGILSLVVVGGYTPLAEFTGNALGRLLSRPGAAGLGAAGLGAAGLGAEGLGAELADPDLAQTAADELLRLDGPIPFIARVATGEIELEGGRIPAGAQVLAVLAAANRDPRVFADPDQADLGRAPNPQLSFGAGPHFCLAAPLVRRAAAIALHRLAARFPRIRAVDPVLRWAPTLLPRKLTAFGVRLS